MRARTLCVLAVAVVCVAVAAPVQAGYIDAVEAANPFLYYQLDEPNPVHATAAINSGSSGVNSEYILTGGNSPAGSFTDVTGMTSEVTPGVQFNRGTWGSTYGAMVWVNPQGSSYDALSSFTIEFLMKPANYDVGPDGIKALYASTSWDSSSVALNLIGSSLQVSVNGGNWGSGVDIGTAVPTGQWSHVAVTYAASGGTSVTNYYVDGNMLASYTEGLGGVANFNQDGTIASYAGNSRFYDGAIDEFAIYNYALDGTTIAEHAGLVPEPSVFVLLATGLIGLLAYAWRRRR